MFSLSQYIHISRIKKEKYQTSTIFSDMKLVKKVFEGLKENLIKNLGTVAKSGTAEFLKHVENQNMR